jgi:hypothetical protein
MEQGKPLHSSVGRSRRACKPECIAERKKARRRAGLKHGVDQPEELKTSIHVLRSLERRLQRSKAKSDEVHHKGTLVMRAPGTFVPRGPGISATQVLLLTGA